MKQSQRAERALMKLHYRHKLLLTSAVALLLLGAIVAASVWLDASGLSTDLGQRNLGPQAQHPFGTDWLGRDMLTRTIKGLTLSLGIGLTAGASSVVIASLMGLAAATLGRTVNRAVSWLTDLFLSVPHLVTLLLIAFVLGGGAKGIVIGVALTHWPSLSRVIRAEVMQLKASPYIAISRNFGRSSWWIATRHMLPHLLPQLLVGMILIVPHAILHEASITFIGMGLSPHEPAIGIILSESMRYLSSGLWWLALFPGLCLLLLVRAIAMLGENLKQWVDPRHAHEQ
ncbi:ABC transporter permease [Paenibacillus sp. GCM10023248]|uniref:ABC transporter permease n=1 Tax=Bacillales TaxID=1385 RepID=UPI002378C5DA|nr:MULTISPECIES: ABC transporter permease [Bacillales]MDD9269028.1 ABC transporter permease [Paenibacillus sp. MAHUQ-63]MDR6884973.1 peptide/nickel transport system permease protein [Bacillus sp. 3255]